MGVNRSKLVVGKPKFLMHVSFLRVVVALFFVCSPKAAAFGSESARSRVFWGRPALTRSHSCLLKANGVKGYFALSDVKLIQRKQDDVDAFNAKERNRWEVVYEEECPESLLESLLEGGFFPGDRVEIIGDDVKVKGIENAKGMQGVVTHYEFDDGYEACQTCSTSVPVAVLLDP